MTDIKEACTKVIRIALRYPKVTKESAMVKSFARRYNFNEEMMDILQQEAEYDAKIPEVCWKCGGNGIDKEWIGYKILCDCINAKRHETIGPIRYGM